MSSRGTGADITPGKAIDILHKLITESRKVQVAFMSGPGVIASVAGIPKLLPDGSVCVADRNEVGAPIILFKPEAASSHTYGDSRAFLNATVLGGPSLSLALVFLFPDGSQIALFEIAREPLIGTN